MATLASNVPQAETPLAWFGRFLKEELAPYPGRSALVIRMVTASTLVMFMTMTFRVPFGAFGAIYALTISRESPQMTVSAVRTIVIAFVLGGGYILAGAIFFVDEPLVRFFWVIASLFLMFYQLSAMSNYVAATSFGYLLVISIPVWDMSLAANTRVENTLWAVAAVGAASLITLSLELIVAALTPGDELVRAIAERLEYAAISLTGYGEGRELPDAVAKNMTRLAMVGTSRLRRILARSNRPPHYRERMGAMVALSGRLIDLAASLEHLPVPLDDHSRYRVGTLASNITNIRAAVLSNRVPQRIEVNRETTPLHRVPLVREMETTVSLIFAVFAGSQPAAAYPLPSSENKASTGLFVSDALSNPEHVRFALKGCLAASLCYIAYNALFWPGISTAITTCFLTAQTSVGASHQKQILRFAGALAGGFGISMLSQIFILPSLDSIAGFTVLFLAVIAVSAWFATSSPRLSYFGVQVAVVFALINLGEFRIQTSLAVARDRAVGVLLGLLMMWFAFDPLWAAPSAVEMKRTFIDTLRLLAQSAREPISEDGQIAISRISSLRETLDKQMSKVRSLADGVLFEFGPTRQQDLALRSQIRQWQPQLRTFLVMRNTLVRYRLQLPGFELPPAVRDAQHEFDTQSARMFESMADRMEGKAGDATVEFKHSFEHLEKEAESAASEARRTGHTVHLETFLPLCRMTEELIDSLDSEIV